jgi:replicative DNA helicase
MDLFLELDKVVSRAWKPGIARTGIQSLDNMMGGGLGAGEMGLVFGPTGSGKSTLAVNFACSLVYLGKEVSFYTLEMPDYQVGMYFVQCLTGFTKDEIKKVEGGKDKAKRKMLAVAKMYHGSVYIKQLQQRKNTTEDVRADVFRRIEETGKIPSLLIIDSPYLLRSVRERERKDIEIDENVQECRAMCQELGIPGWGMGQANREGENPETETVTNFHLAGSYAQAQTVDVCLSVSQTSGERERNEARLFLAKNREDRSRVSVKVRYDLARRRITDLD